MKEEEEKEGESFFQVAGTFVFLYAPIGHVDSFGEILFSSLLAQGVPATAHVVQVSG